MATADQERTREKLHSQETRSNQRWADKRVMEQSRPGARQRRQHQLSTRKRNYCSLDTREEEKLTAQDQRGRATKRSGEKKRKMEEQKRKGGKCRTESAGPKPAIGSANRLQ